MKRSLRTLLILLVRLVGAAGARTTARRAKLAAPFNPRILLIRPDYLGDVVLATPVLNALKTSAPQAHVTMMVGPWSADVVARHPDVDQLLTCPFPNLRQTSSSSAAPYLLMLRTAKQLRRGNYDLAINLRHNYWWGAALLYLARIPRRIGYAVEPHTGVPFLTEALPSQPQEHLTVSSLRLVSAGLKALGYPELDKPYTAERYPLHFIPTAEERQWVTERLNAEQIAPSTLVLLIHPGTGIAVKLWRSEAWIHCAITLAYAARGSTPMHVILTGSKSERPLLEEIARGIPARTTLFTEMTIGQLAALLQRAQLVLGVDSGPLHLAVAQGTPTVRIFGPTNPRRCGPWGRQEQHSVIVSTQRCPSCATIPCGRLDFRPQELALHPCTRLVPAQQVLDTIARDFPYILTSVVETQRDIMGSSAFFQQMP